MTRPLQAERKAAITQRTTRYSRGMQKNIWNVQHTEPRSRRGTTAGNHTVSYKQTTKGQDFKNVCVLISAAIFR